MICPPSERLLHQNSIEVSPSVSSAKNGALAFLSVTHAPKAVDEVADPEVSPRHKDETLAESSRPTASSVRTGLRTEDES